jgi:hypothetical protein
LPVGTAGVRYLTAGGAKNAEGLVLYTFRLTYI